MLCRKSKNIASDTFRAFYLNSKTITLLSTSPQGLVPFWAGVPQMLMDLSVWMNFAGLNLQPPKVDSTTLSDFAHGNNPLDLISALLTDCRGKSPMESPQELFKYKSLFRSMHGFAIWEMPWVDLLHNLLRSFNMPLFIQLIYESTESLVFMQE